MSTPPSGTRRVTPCRDVRNPPMDNYGNRIYVFYETLNNFNGGWLVWRYYFVLLACHLSVSSTSLLPRCCWSWSILHLDGCFSYFLSPPHHWLGVIVSNYESSSQHPLWTFYKWIWSRMFGIPNLLKKFGLLEWEVLTNYMAYGTWRFNATFTRALQ